MLTNAMLTSAMLTNSTLPGALQMIALAAFSLTVAAVSAADLKNYRIPDRVLLPGTMVCALALLTASIATEDWVRFQQALLGATLSSAAYLVLHLAAKGGIGFGDVKLAALIGLMTGWHSPRAAIVALPLALVGAGIVGLALLVSRQITRQTPIPLAPFMSLAAIAVLVPGG